MLLYAESHRTVNSVLLILCYDLFKTFHSDSRAVTAGVTFRTVTRDFSSKLPEQLWDPLSGYFPTGEPV